MLIGDIKRVVEQVSRDKGIDRNVLIKALEEALKSAARKKFGSKADIEVQYNEETGEIEVFQFKEIVDEITEPDLQITLAEGHQLDPESEIGDSLGVKMDTTTFGRIAAQSAKQVIIQKMKDAERDAVFSSFIDRKGEIINGIVQRIERGNIIVNLGHTEGMLPTREQVPRETYRRAAEFAEKCRWDSFSACLLSVPCGSAVKQLSSPGSASCVRVTVRRPWAHRIDCSKTKHWRGLP